MGRVGAFVAGLLLAFVIDLIIYGAAASRCVVWE